MTLQIEPLQIELLTLFNEHFARHRAESGRGDYHFMPFAPDDPQGPKGLDSSRFNLPLTEPAWQRWWIAWDAEQKTIVGHVDLKGGPLPTCLHRCELGIGIERDFRGSGLGRRLMETAMAFVRAQPGIDWLDLRVFGHNTNARALYQKLGFIEVGEIKDFVRIGSTSIDDVLMTLKVTVP